MGLAEAYQYCADVMTKNLLEDEAKEGIGAFLNHREPVWP